MASRREQLARCVNDPAGCHWLGQCSGPLGHGPSQWHLEPALATPVEDFGHASDRPFFRPLGAPETGRKACPPTSWRGTGLLACLPSQSF
jgi:hypothetical protein